MIIIYSSPQCANCKIAKKELESLDVNFNSVDITTNNAARNILLKEGFMSLPIFEFNGQFTDSLEEVIELTKQ